MNAIYIFHQIYTIRNCAFYTRKHNIYSYADMYVSMHYTMFLSDYLLVYISLLFTLVSTSTLLSALYSLSPHLPLLFFPNPMIIVIHGLVSVLSNY